MNGVNQNDLSRVRIHDLRLAREQLLAYKRVAYCEIHYPLNYGMWQSVKTYATLESGATE